MSLFLPITKVDARQRLVYGTISEEVPDKAGEILDYESSRPAFEAWSNQFRDASGGRSLGNVRAMHGRVAAGKLTDIHFDDANRRIDGVAKIIDEDEWQKVLEGVYTGFSIGGGYARRWPDPENPMLTRYTPVLSEVSLVDNPAVPTATFEMVRSDGSIELRKFLPPGKATAPTDEDFQAAAEAQAENTPTVAALLTGLTWLALHAKTIGALGLLAHIVAIKQYLEETDEGDPIFTDETQQGESLKSHIGQLQKRISDLEAQPMPAKGMLRAVSKGDDRAFVAEPERGRSKEEYVHELMKAALARPIYF